MSAKVEGVTPFAAICEPVLVTVEELLKRIVSSQRTNGPLLDAYHDLWYHSGHTWVLSTFLGVPCLKNPNDLWMYQELLTQFRFKTIIETGTYAGGSALWFAFLMDALNIEGGRIFTIDFEDHRHARAPHPRVTYLAADSRDPILAKALASDLQYPLLVSLDADHDIASVTAELELFRPLCRVGDWLVVEDTNVRWPQDRGAHGAVEDFLARHPKEWAQDQLCERYLLTMNPGGWLQRVTA